MILPRILVLDDLMFWSEEERKRFCKRLGLLDTRDPANIASGQTVSTDAYVAAAVFQSGQIQTGDEIKNDIDEALRQVELGWGDEWRWSLVLLDLQFDKGPVRACHVVDPDSNWPPFADRDFIQSAASSAFSVRMGEKRWRLRRMPPGSARARSRNSPNRKAVASRLGQFRQGRLLLLHAPESPRSKADRVGSFMQDGAFRLSTWRDVYLFRRIVPNAHNIRACLRAAI